jgi:hypothetical protein
MSAIFFVYIQVWPLAEAIPASSLRVARKNGKRGKLGWGKMAG